MSYKRTLIFLVVCAFLAGFFYVYEIKGGPRRKEAEEQAKRLVPVEPGEVSRVSIERPRERIVVEKQDGGWRVVQPVDAPADQDNIDQLVKAVAELKYERDLGEQDKLEPYKLSQPELSIEVAGDGRRLARVLIGPPTPDGKNFYLKKDTGKQVYTAAVSAREQLDQDLFAIRDKHLLNFSPPDVSAIKVRRDSGSLSLEKNEGRWRMTAPAQHDADSEKVSQLLDALKYARVKSFVEEEAPDLERYGLKQPKAQVELQAGNQRRIVSFGTKTGPDAKLVYAAVDDTRRVVELDEAILEKITLAPSEWRDRFLAAFEPRETVKLAVETPQARVTVQEDKEKPGEWLMVEPQTARADAGRIDALLRKLAKAKAVRFVEEGKIKQAKRLLENPRLRLHVWRKNEERPLVLSFAHEGAEWIATTATGDICIAGSELIDDLSVTPDDLMDKSVVHFDAPDVEKIELVKKDKTYSIKREDVDWDIPRGLKMQAYEVDQLLWDLRELKYTKVSTDAEVSQSFEAPLLIIRLWNEGAQEPQMITVVARAAAEDSYYLRGAESGRLMEGEGGFLSELLEKL